MMAMYRKNCTNLPCKLRLFDIISCPSWSPEYSERLHIFSFGWLMILIRMLLKVMPLGCLATSSSLVTCTFPVVRCISNTAHTQLNSPNPIVSSNTTPIFQLWPSLRSSPMITPVPETISNCFLAQAPTVNILVIHLSMRSRSKYFVPRSVSLSSLGSRPISPVINVYDSDCIALNAITSCFVHSTLMTQSSTITVTQLTHFWS